MSDSRTVLLTRQCFRPTVLFNLACLFIWTVVAGCSPSDEGASTDASTETKIRLALNWFPEAEHGGFYAALVHGYYKEAGLDVEIVPGGPGAPVIQEVATGRVEFGVVNADQILLARNQGASVVALMAPLQNSPRCIMVREDSKITSFNDLKNITLAISGGKPFSLYLKKKLPLSGVQFVPSPGGNVAMFLTQNDYAQQAYVFSEPFVVQKKGGAARNLMLSELGFNPYASVLFTSDETLKTNSPLVKKFTQASKRGWEKYLADSEQTNDHIEKQNPEMGREILDFGAQAMKPLCQPDEGLSIGAMTSARWKTLVKQMQEIEAIKPDLRADDCFTTEFLTNNKPQP